MPMQAKKVIYLSLELLLLVLIEAIPLVPSVDDDCVEGPPYSC